jgi:hypothetical protein
MARTTFSGPVKSDNGFEGSFIGTLAITESGNTITTTNTATSGTYQPLVVDTTMSGAGADGGRSKFSMSTNVALGSFSNALKAEVTYGASGRTTGLGSAFVAEMTLSAGTSSGTYAPIEIELNMGGSGSTGTSTSLIYASVNGAAATTFDDNGFIMTLAGLTAGAGDAIATPGATFAATATGTALGGANLRALKIKVGSTTYYVLAMPASTYTT